MRRTTSSACASPSRAAARSRFRPGNSPREFRARPLRDYSMASPRTRRCSSSTSGAPGGRRGMAERAPTRRPYRRGSAWHVVSARATYRPDAVDRRRQGPCADQIDRRDRAGGGFRSRSLCISASAPSATFIWRITSGRCRWLRSHVVLGAAEAPGPRRHGLVTRRWRRTLPIDGVKVYFAGPPPMVDAATRCCGNAASVARYPCGCVFHYAGSAGAG